MYCRNYTGTVSCVVSFVERFIILCPYLGETTIRGSTVYQVGTSTQQTSIQVSLGWTTSADTSKHAVCHALNFHKQSE